MPSVIAVAVDGSSPGYAALQWAMDSATTHRASVIAVIARPSAIERARDPIRSTDRHHREIDDHLVAVREAIERTCNHTSVAIEVLEGHPTEALLAVGDRAQLLVVGARAPGGWREALTSSLSDQLAAHTTVPLCVVREPPDRTHGRIVVGHDGTGAAIRFGAAEAQARGADLQVLSTWHYPRDTKATSAEAALILAEGAGAALASHVDDARRNHPGVQIDTEVRLGQPVAELAALSVAADMVVVGAQSRGGLTALMTGSIAAGVLRRVRIPVVVVPQ